MMQCRQINLQFGLNWHRINQFDGILDEFRAFDGQFDGRLHTKCMIGVQITYKWCISSIITHKMPV